MHALVVDLIGQCSVDHPMSLKCSLRGVIIGMKFLSSIPTHLASEGIRYNLNAKVYGLT
jgi:hypothetical protein